MSKKIMCILYITFFSLGVVSVNNVKADTNSASNNTTSDNIVVDNSSSQVINSKHVDNNFSTQETNKVAASNYNYSADSADSSEKKMDILLKHRIILQMIGLI